MFHCAKNASEFMGASTSGLLQAAVLLSKVLIVPVSTYKIRLHMVYEGGSKGCKKTVQSAVFGFPHVQ